MFRRHLTYLYTGWQIRHAIAQLANASPAVCETAKMRLRGAYPRSLQSLRVTAFRQRSLPAIRAAELLYEMEDAQGLYALLAQYADRFMFLQYGPILRAALKRIGRARIVNVLDVALENIETRPMMREHWSLSLSVYALHALEPIGAMIPASLWRRALTAHNPGFEGLHIARSLLATLEKSAAGGSIRDMGWYVGSSLVAVRRAAIDTLLTLEGDQAFDLLRQALAHDAPEVQLTAIYGLRRLQDPRAYILLQPIAADRRHPLTRDARRAIESFGSRQPDELTLMRASISQSEPVTQLLRAAHEQTDEASTSLLRATYNPNER